jgi:hypothetical protein
VKPDQWINHDALRWSYSAEVAARLRSKPNALLVLRSYALRANDDDEAWPATETVQSENGIGSDNTVARCLKALCALGLLERLDVRRDLGGAQVYRVKWRIGSSAVIGAELRSDDDASKIRTSDVEVRQSGVRSSAPIGADEEVEQGEEDTTYVEVGTDDARASASEQEAVTDEARKRERGDEATRRALAERYLAQRPIDAPAELEVHVLAAASMLLDAVGAGEASTLVDRAARVSPQTTLTHLAMRAANRPPGRAA